MDNGTTDKNPPAPSASKKPTRLTLIVRKSSAQARIEGLNPDIFGEDDYSVVDGETPVGGVYPELIHGEPKWRWFLQTARRRHRTAA
jgi:hypothetical protein